MWDEFLDTARYGLEDGASARYRGRCADGCSLSVCSERNWCPRAVDRLPFPERAACTAEISSSASLQHNDLVARWCVLVSAGVRSRRRPESKRAATACKERLRLMRWGMLSLRGGVRVDAFAGRCMSAPNLFKSRGGLSHHAHRKVNTQLRARLTAAHDAWRISPGVVDPLAPYPGSSEER